MPGNERFIELLRVHKGWADRYSLLSGGLLVALSIAVIVVGQMGAAEPQTVTQMIVLVCAIVLAVTVWQAAAMVAARLDLQRSQAQPED